MPGGKDLWVRTRSIPHTGLVHHILSPSGCESLPND